MAKKKPKGRGSRKPPKPRQRVIAGMEETRYSDLDAICESIANYREKQEKAKTNEAEELAEALKAMRKHNVPKYSHDTVVLKLKEGEAKVVATIKVEKPKKKEDTETPAGGEVGSTLGD